MSDAKRCMVIVVFVGMSVVQYGRQYTVVGTDKHSSGTSLSRSNFLCSHLIQGSLDSQHILVIKSKGNLLTLEGTIQ